MNKIPMTKWETVAFVLWVPSGLSVIGAPIIFGIYFGVIPAAISFVIAMSISHWSFYMGGRYGDRCEKLKREQKLPEPRLIREYNDDGEFYHMVPNPKYKPKPKVESRILEL